MKAYETNSTQPGPPKCEECPYDCLYGNPNKCKNIEAVGPTPASILIVGEAPGADEDEGGEPFIGRSGELLFDLFSALNTTRDQVRITNTVSCRPPSNETPKTDALIACQSRFLKDIEDANPEVIITLGKTALQATTHNNADSPSFDHGLPRLAFIGSSATPVVVVPIYHPGYILRNGAKAAWWAQSAKAGAEAAQSLRNRVKEATQ
jgi:DNA polymerase